MSRAMGDQPQAFGMTGGNNKGKSKSGKRDDHHDHHSKIRAHAEDLPRYVYHEPTKRWEGIVHSTPSFNAEQDVEELRKAMRGIGTDEACIIRVLGNRTNEERQRIREIFMKRYGKDLLEEFRSELSGAFLDVCLNICKRPVTYDAYCLHQALKNLGTDEDCIHEILVTRSPHEMRLIKEEYQRRYHSRLEDDIKSDTSGDYRRLLNCLLSDHRDTDTKVYREKVYKIVEDLVKAGPARFGTEEGIFIKQIASRSPAYLRAIENAYPIMTGQTLQQMVESETSGNMKRLLLALIRSTKCRQLFFAQELHEALTSFTNKIVHHSRVARIIIGRLEHDFRQIKEAYWKEYHENVEDTIKQETSGDFGKMLLVLVTEHRR